MTEAMALVEGRVGT